MADGAGANNWAIAFFDEIKVVYETAPDTERAYDTVMIYATQGDGLAENLSQYKLYWKPAQNKN